VIEECAVDRLALGPVCEDPCAVQASRKLMAQKSSATDFRGKPEFCGLWKMAQLSKSSGRVFGSGRRFGCMCEMHMGENSHGSHAGSLGNISFL